MSSSYVQLLTTWSKLPPTEMVVVGVPNSAIPRLRDVLGDGGADREAFRRCVWAALLDGAAIMTGTAVRSSEHRDEPPAAAPSRPTSAVDDGSPPMSKARRKMLLSRRPRADSDAWLMRAGGPDAAMAEAASLVLPEAIVTMLSPSRATAATPAMSAPPTWPDESPDLSVLKAVLRSPISFVDCSGVGTSSRVEQDPAMARVEATIKRKIDALFSDIDVNGNDNVDWEEFSLHLISSVKPLQGNSESDEDDEPPVDADEELDTTTAATSGPPLDVMASASVDVSAARATVDAGSPRTVTAGAATLAALDVTALASAGSPHSPSQGGNAPQGVSSNDNPPTANPKAKPHNAKKMTAESRRALSADYVASVPLSLLRLPKQRSYAPLPLQWLPGWEKFLFLETLPTGAGSVTIYRINDVRPMDAQSPDGAVERPAIAVHAEATVPVVVDSATIVPPMNALCVALANGRLRYLTLSHDYLAEEYDKPQSVHVVRDQHFPGNHTIMRWDAEVAALVLVEASGRVDVINPMEDICALPRILTSFEVGSPVHDIVILPERGVKKIICSTIDGRLAVFDLMLGTHLLDLCDTLRAAHSIAFSEQMTLLVSCSAAERDALIWAPHATTKTSIIKKLVDPDDTRQKAKLMQVVCIPKSVYCATADIKGHIRVFDLRSNALCLIFCSNGEPLTESKTTTRMCRAIAVDPKRMELIALTRDDHGAALSLFGIRFTSLFKAFAAHDDAVIAMCVAPCQGPLSEIVFTASDKVVHVWQLQTGMLRQRLENVVYAEPGKINMITCIASESHGRRFFIGTSDGSCSMHSSSTGARLGLLSSAGAAGPVEKIAVQSTKGICYVAHTGGAVTCWALTADVLNCMWTAEPPLTDASQLTAFDFSDALSMCVCGDSKSAVVEFDAAHNGAGTTVGTVPPPQNEQSSASVPEEDSALRPKDCEVTCCVIASPRPVAFIGDARGLLSLVTLRPHPHAHMRYATWRSMSARPGVTVAAVPLSMAVNVDGAVLFVGDDQGHVSVWDLADAVEKYALYPTIFPPVASPPLPKADPNSVIPRFTSAFAVHHGANSLVNNLAYLPSRDRLIVAVESTVAVWTAWGECLGLLLQARTPERPMVGGVAFEAFDDPVLSMSAGSRAQSPATSEAMTGIGSHKASPSRSAAGAASPSAPRHHTHAAGDFCAIGVELMAPLPPGHFVSLTRADYNSMYPDLSTTPAVEGGELGGGADRPERRGDKSRRCRASLSRPGPAVTYRWRGGADTEEERRFVVVVEDPWIPTPPPSRHEFDQFRCRVLTTLPKASGDSAGAVRTGALLHGESYRPVSSQRSQPRSLPPRGLVDNSEHSLEAQTERLVVQVGEALHRLITEHMGEGSGVKELQPPVKSATSSAADGRANRTRRGMTVTLTTDVTPPLTPTSKNERVIIFNRPALTKLQPPSSTGVGLMSSDQNWTLTIDNAAARPPPAWIVHTIKTFRSHAIWRAPAGTLSGTLPPPARLLPTPQLSRATSARSETSDGSGGRQLQQSGVNMPRPTVVIAPSALVLNATAVGSSSTTSATRSRLTPMLDESAIAAGSSSVREGDEKLPISFVSSARVPDATEDATTLQSARANIDEQLAAEAPPVDAAAVLWEGGLGTAAGSLLARPATAAKQQQSDPNRARGGADGNTAVATQPARSPQTTDHQRQLYDVTKSIFVYAVADETVARRSRAEALLQARPTSTLRTGRKGQPASGGAGGAPSGFAQDLADPLWRRPPTSDARVWESSTSIGGRHTSGATAPAQIAGHKTFIVM